MRGEDVTTLYCFTRPNAASRWAARTGISVFPDVDHNASVVPPSEMDSALRYARLHTVDWIWDPHIHGIDVGVPTPARPATPSDATPVAHAGGRRTIHIPEPDIFAGYEHIPWEEPPATPLSTDEDEGASRPPVPVVPSGGDGPTYRGTRGTCRDSPPVTSPAGLTASMRNRLERSPVPPPAAIYRIVTEEARSHGVAPEFVLAIIGMESQFRQTARGGADEVGLMQIHPSVMRTYGVTAEQVRDPRTNIRTGCRLMRDLLRNSAIRDLPEPRRTNAMIAAYAVGIGNWRRRPCFGQYRQRRVYVIRALAERYRRWMEERE